LIDPALAPFVVVGVFLALLLIGTPIAVVLGLTGLAGLVVLGDPPRIGATAVGRSVSQLGLLAIPFYVLAGVLLERSGIARALLRFINALIGHVRGSLVVTAGGTSVVFGGISGSGPADVAALSLVFVPPMEERGYKREFGAALCAAGGSLGLIIPPSAGYILYALITQQASIVDLFVAGILPGLIMTLAFMGVIFSPLSAYTTVHLPKPLPVLMRYTGRSPCMGTRRWWPGLPAFRLPLGSLR
jgi:C4-dicarboxylate transporter, DctM subunit